MHMYIHDTYNYLLKSYLTKHTRSVLRYLLSLSQTYPTQMCLRKHV
jgi:hypothetical protein